MIKIKFDKHKYMVISRWSISFSDNQAVIANIPFLFVYALAELNKDIGNEKNGRLGNH